MRLDKTDVLARLKLSSFYRDAIPSLKQNGTPEAVGLCPFHDDRNPSFGVNLQTGLWMCHAGCGQGSVFDFVMKQQGVMYSDALKMLAERAGLPCNSDPRRMLRKFLWTDAEGREAWHLRWDSGQKFSWAQDPDGRKPGLKPCHPTLYRLSEVDAASVCIVVEGERDADTLNGWLDELGQPNIRATTTPHGASTVDARLLTPLFGKTELYISGDNDTAGEGYVGKLQAALMGRVNVLRLLVSPTE